MRDALKSYLALAAGVSDVTRQRALAAAKALVNQGEATAEQVSGLAEDLLEQTRQNREAVAALVSFEVDRALGRLGLATSEEVTGLTQRIRELEAQVRRTVAGVGRSDVAARERPDVPPDAALAQSVAGVDEQPAGVGAASGGAAADDEAPAK